MHCNSSYVGVVLSKYMSNPSPSSFGDNDANIHLFSLLQELIIRDF